MMVGTNRIRRLVVALLAATSLCAVGGIATASAAGPTAPHGTGVGDDNQGRGAAGDAGNIGGCIVTFAGPVALTQSPFAEFGCE
jgi:hypothetical protein